MGEDQRPEGDMTDKLADDEEVEKGGWEERSR